MPEWLQAAGGGRPASLKTLLEHKDSLSLAFRLLGLSWPPLSTGSSSFFIRFIIFLARLPLQLHRTAQFPSGKGPQGLGGSSPSFKHKEIKAQGFGWNPTGAEWLLTLSCCLPGSWPSWPEPNCPMDFCVMWGLYPHLYKPALRYTSRSNPEFACACPQTIPFPPQKRGEGLDLQFCAAL